MGRKRADFERLRRSRRAQRRARVATFYNQGLTIKEIAKRVQASRRSVCEDMHVLHRQWLEKSASEINKAKVQQLQRIDWIEDEAWSAWGRSKLPSITQMTKTVSGGEGGEVVTDRRTAKHQVGDPQFMALILSCISLRSRILGLYAAKQPATVKSAGKVPAELRHIMANLSEEEREAMRGPIEKYRRLINAGFGHGN